MQTGQTGQTGIAIILFITYTVQHCNCIISNGYAVNTTLKNLQIRREFSHSPLFSIPKTTFKSMFSIHMSSFAKIASPLFHLSRSKLLVSKSQFNSLSKELCISSSEQQCVYNQEYSGPELNNVCFVECIFKDFVTFNSEQLSFSKCSFYTSTLITYFPRTDLSLSHSSFDETAFYIQGNLQKFNSIETNFSSCSGYISVIDNDASSIYCCYWNNHIGNILITQSNLTINGMFVKNFESSVAVLLSIPDKTMIVKNSIFNSDNYFFDGYAKSIIFENCCFKNQNNAFAGTGKTSFTNQKEIGSCYQNVFISDIVYKVNYLKVVTLYVREHEVDWSIDSTE